MQKIILHIGRHKSGTSSIQHWLKKNQSQLLKKGICYPNAGTKGVAHHQIASALSRKNIKKEGIPTYLNDIKRQLKKESLETSHIIISSEGFQNCDPRVIKEFFSNYNVSVVVYFRDPISYLGSSYAQKVHATDYCENLEAFSMSFSFNYLKFLKEWKSQFDSLIVHEFKRENLANGCVIEDFKKIIFDISTLENEEEFFKGFEAVEDDKNPSLSNQLVNLKRFLNKQSLFKSLIKQYPGKIYSIFQYLATINPGKKGFSVPCELLKLEKIKSEFKLDDLSNMFFDGKPVFEYWDSMCTSKNLEGLDKVDPSVLREFIFQSEQYLDSQVIDYLVEILLEEYGNEFIELLLQKNNIETRFCKTLANHLYLTGNENKYIDYVLGYYRVLINSENEDYVDRAFLLLSEILKTAESFKLYCEKENLKDAFKKYSFIFIKDPLFEKKSLKRATFKVAICISGMIRSGFETKSSINKLVEDFKEEGIEVDVYGHFWDEIQTYSPGGQLRINRRLPEDLVSLLPFESSDLDGIKSELPNTYKVLESTEYKPFTPDIVRGINNLITYEVENQKEFHLKNGLLKEKDLHCKGNLNQINMFYGISQVVKLANNSQRDYDFFIRMRPDSFIKHYDIKNLIGELNKSEVRTRNITPLGCGDVFFIAQPEVMNVIAMLYDNLISKKNTLLFNDKKIRFAENLLAKWLFKNRISYSTVRSIHATLPARFINEVTMLPKELKGALEIDFKSLDKNKPTWYFDFIRKLEEYEKNNN